MNARRAGFDARRRNRNIGTENQGFKQSNAMVVPESWHSDRVFYETLRDPRIVTRSLHGRELTFLVEPTRPGCVHACSVDDMLSVLSRLPETDRLLVKTFVLRQPTRKQQMLKPVWGRLVYWASLGRYEGVTVYLEAQDFAAPMRWSRSLDPQAAAELERLRQDGHRIEQDKRGFSIHCDLESTRAPQLYRTLPHEIGHYVHYRRNLERDIDHRALPADEKERFAHRYADELAARLREQEQIPFPRILSKKSLSMDGLSAEWFGV